MKFKWNAIVVFTFFRIFLVDASKATTYGTQMIRKLSSPSKSFCASTPVPKKSNNRRISTSPSNETTKVPEIADWFMSPIAEDPKGFKRRNQKNEKNEKQDSIWDEELSFLSVQLENVTIRDQSDLNHSIFDEKTSLDTLLLNNEQDDAENENESDDEIELFEIEDDSAEETTALKEQSHIEEIVPITLIEEPKPKYVPSTAEIEFSSSLLKKVVSQAESTMKFMRSTDLSGKNGVNEAGFKMIIVSAILDLFCKEKRDTPCEINTTSEKPFKLIKIESELAVGEGFSDLILSFEIEGKSFSILFELKYIRGSYIKGSYHRQNKISRRKLNDLADRMPKMNEEEILSLLHRDYDHGYMPVKDLLYGQKLKDQIEKYLSQAHNQSIVAFGMVGVASRILTTDIFINQQ